MRAFSLRMAWARIFVPLAIVLIGSSMARAQAPSSSSTGEPAKGGPVVRTFGTESGYRTEVTSETKGTLTQEDQRQVSLLAAQVFLHLDEARQAIDADDLKRAHKEVNKGEEAIKAVRALLPRTTVRTRTTGPDGKVIYEDEREVQDDQVPLFEGMLHSQTLAPVVAAKRDAVEVTGVRLVGSESISTEAIADLGIVESQLKRAARALDDHKASDAARALTAAQVRGVDFRYTKEDTPLAEARDAIWLARRALEENNGNQAQTNLNIARQRLRVYREIAPQDRRSDVDQMLREADQLEAQLRQETTQKPASQAERTRQGNSLTRWWDQVNGWFKRRF